MMNPWTAQAWPRLQVVLSAAPWYVPVVIRNVEDASLQHHTGIHVSHHARKAVEISFMAFLTTFTRLRREPFGGYVDSIGAYSAGEPIPPREPYNGPTFFCPLVVQM